MKVPFNYLPNQFNKKNKFFSEWKKLIDSCEFTLGPYVKNFEKKFAKFIGSKFCISTNSGTDALILALRSLGVKQGDEVITVCNTFYATVGAIVACGAKPIFVDCNQNYQIDYTKIEKAITKKTKVILPVHWAGSSPEINKIVIIAKKYKISIIEDACMGIGARINGKSPGTFGKLSAFSMHPLKSLNVMGDGGMLVTDDYKIYSWLKKYRNHGMISRDKIEFWGINTRLQPLQAVVANIELNKIPSIIKKRNYNAKKLDEGLAKLSLGNKIIIPVRNKSNSETFALYMGLFNQRDKLIKYLNNNNIEAKIHYKIPLHLQKAAKNLGYKKGSFPCAEYQASKLITLPIHQYINNNKINYMIKKIYEFYKN